MRVFLTFLGFILCSMTAWSAEFEEDSRKIREIIDLNYNYRESGEVEKRLDFFSSIVTSVYNGSINRYEKDDLRIGFTKVYESTRTEIEVLDRPTILFSNDGSIAYAADATIVKVYDRNTGSRIKEEKVSNLIVFRKEAKKWLVEMVAETSEN